MNTRYTRLLCPTQIRRSQPDECIPDQDAPHTDSLKLLIRLLKPLKVLEEEFPAINQSLFCLNFRSCFGAVSSKDMGCDQRR